MSLLSIFRTLHTHPESFRVPLKGLTKDGTVLLRDKGRPILLSKGVSVRTG